MICRALIVDGDNDHATNRYACGMVVLRLPTFLSASPTY